jgi:hypothetical protein
MKDSKGSLGRMTKDRLRQAPFSQPRPHVVILGAGASRAAMPTGDKFGNMIPLIDDLPTILGAEWEVLILDAQPPEGNFESKYSWIRNSNKYAKELSSIEHLIESYFSSLSLPDQATIYDYMVLGLRGKDIIATFNWDPFLLQAHRRNTGVIELPDIRFLHGCVNFATCTKHDILGVPSETCLECHHELVRGHLFYPEENKDYTKDALIYRDWDKVTKQLQEAFHLTIFGYSGPATDYNARKLLLDSWNQTPVQKMCHAEIIDIKDHTEIRNYWADYFPYDHHMVCSNFWESSMAKWPRRTAEWKESASRYGIPSESLDLIKTDSLVELQEWFSKLAETEDTHNLL